MMVRRNCMDEDDLRTDDLVSRYKLEAQESISTEAERRVSQTIPMKERIRLRALSLYVLVERGIESPDLIPALLERLGPVRAALDGHGGGVAVVSVETGDSGLEFVLDLTGACLSCGAAPGTLAGVRSDLENDLEINSIKFSSALLETFDELGREFVLSHGGVEFV